MDDFARGLRILSSARDTAAYLKGLQYPTKQKENTMPEGVLEKMKSVLDLADEQPFEGFATFQQSDDDEEGVWTKQFQMPTADWDDMGRPEVITITVKPGDTLNPDDKPEHE
jgi:hypothetical protein